MNQDDLKKFLVESFVEFWMLDAPTLRPTNEVLMSQAILWAKKADQDLDFSEMDAGEWAWLLDSARVHLAGIHKLLQPVPTWASLCAYRKSQGVRENLQRHRAKPDESKAREPSEKQSPSSLALRMLEDDLAAFLTSRDLGRETAMFARGVAVVDSCAALASQGLGNQVGELFERLNVDSGAKEILASIKTNRNAVV
jgi:hypothetical protein